MKYFLPLLLALICLTPLSSEERQEQFTLAQFRQAAGSLQNAPLGPNAKQYSKIVITSTVQSPTVEVTIGPPIMGIIDAGESQAEMSLLSSYAAGQALAQLDNKVKGGYPEEGGKRVIEVYRKIQAVKPNYTNPAVERLIQAEAQGQLKELLAPR